MDNIAENFEYIGLFLSKEDKSKLEDYLIDFPLTSNLIARGNLYLDHCTLLHCTCKDESLKRAILTNLHFNKGKNYTITITHIGINDRALAFKVDLGNLLCQNENPHITISTDKYISPVESNDIKIWLTISPIEIEARLDYKSKNKK